MKALHLTFSLLLLAVSLCAQYDKNKEKVFTSLEEALQENPMRIYYLDLKQKDLKEFPKVILQFENLIHLNLAHNEISSLEGVDFSSLKHLEEIVLYDNKFRFFPYEALQTVPNLYIVDLGENDLKEINEDLSQLKFIEEIELSGNRITTIASDIKLPFLKIFHIERNHLNEFPGFIVQSPKLKSLNIYGNNIKEIPKAINALSKLKYLNIGDNPLDRIDEAISLRKLKTLILDWVDLSKEGLSLEFLKKSSLIETFSIEHCNLTKIPEEVFAFRRLKEFSILNNDLLTINHQIIKNKRLSKFWISGNQLNDQDIMMLKQKMSNTEFINQ